MLDDEAIAQVRLLEAGSPVGSSSASISPTSSSARDGPAPDAFPRGVPRRRPDQLRPRQGPGQRPGPDGRDRRFRSSSMYRYDDFDRDFLAARNAQFRAQVERRLDGSLTEDEFKPLRLMNGVYLQLHAYMLRVAIPYGTLSSAQMRVLAEIGGALGQGLRPFHHAPEHPVQLAAPDRHSRHARPAGRRRHARDPDVRQHDPQRDRRPFRRRRGRRDRSTRAPWPSCCANGPPTTRSSSSCRASSRSPSPARRNDRAVTRAHDIGLVRAGRRRTASSASRSSSAAASAGRR